MPSDRPPPEPSAPGSDPAGRRRATKAVRDGTLAFALVLGGFVAYALGAPATYRATAVVAVEAIPGRSPVELPKASDASERLRRAALDPAVVATLASEERPAPPDTVAQVSARLSNALSVESSDGRHFAFAATASSPERSQRIANELAQQAAKRAAQVLDPQPQPQAEPGEKARAELLEFLAAHPGVSSEPTVAPVRSGPDALVLALRAERAHIEEKLAQLSTASIENPYDETKPLENPTSLRRRLKEIDNALEARSKPPTKPSAAPAASVSSPELRAEWQRLLRAVSESKSEPLPAAAPRLRVTLARAALPRLPVEPDRPRLVLLGLLISSLAGVLAGLLRGVVEAGALRRYGMITGAYAAVPLPQTTLRIPREQLPKPLAPRTDPPPTPLPAAPAKPLPMTPIPPAPLVPSPITPVPPAPRGPAALTPMPAAPRVPTPITPIPPATLGPANFTPIPPAPKALPGPITPIPPAKGTTATSTDRPPAGVAPPAMTPIPAGPMVIQGPSPGPEFDGPPTTQAYRDPQEPLRPARNAARRITKIYGTPPPPDLEGEAKALRTTQAFGSPPVAIPPNRPPEIPDGSITPFPAEVLAPVHRSSLTPSPMIPLKRSSTPPAVASSNRSGAPLAETGYSYVTPVPEAHSIPQTPYPRRPSPPPRTEPYGSIPPVQPRKPLSNSPSNPPANPPAADPNRPKTPLPPPPTLSAPSVVMRTHRVDSSWRPSATLAPDRRKVIAGEILTLAVERCLVVGVTGVRGTTDKKSMAAAEIALALAEAKHPRVLLMESDFQYPQVQKWLNLEVPLAAGFSQQLRGRIDGGRERRWHVVECSSSLHVLAEGVMRSPGLLLSNRFEEAMREFRSYYDIIVIDAPVAPSEADGRAIADVVDGAVVVGPPTSASEIVDVSRIFSGKKLLRVIEG